MKHLTYTDFKAIIAEPVNAKALSSDDWEVLLYILDIARLEAWLAAKLDSSKVIVELPSTVQARLASATIYAQRQQQQVHYECDILVRLLAEKGIEPLFLKGAAYVVSPLFYSAGRICSDIDALVRREQLEAAEQHLKINMWRAQDVDDYDEKYYREYAHEIPPMLQVQRGTVLDLHHNLFLPVSGRAPNIEQFWAMRHVTDSGLATLQPPAALVHSMIHLLMNEEVTYGLRDCLDMQSIIDAHASDSFWQQTIELVESNGLQREYQLLLHLLDALFARPSLQSQLAARGISPTRSMRFWLWCYQKAVMPVHPQLKNPYAGLARALVYCRGHKQKMPLVTLLKHSSIKLYKSAWRKIVGDPDE